MVGLCDDSVRNPLHKISANRTDIYIPESDSNLGEVFQRIDERFARVSHLERSQTVTSASPLVIDLAKGEYIILVLSADIKSIAFANWKPASVVNRVTLELHSNGASIDLSFAEWPNGAVPTPNAGTHRYSLTSTDAGATVYGEVLGLSYSAQSVATISAGAPDLGTPAFTVHA